MATYSLVIAFTASEIARLYFLAGGFHLATRHWHYGPENRSALSTPRYEHTLSLASVNAPVYTVVSASSTD